MSGQIVVVWRSCLEQKHGQPITYKYNQLAGFLVFIQHSKQSINRSNQPAKMSAFNLALAALTLGSAVHAQQAGSLTAEKHPPLTVSTCTSSGCTSKAQSVVLDSNWRWTHSTSSSTNCYTGNTWDATLCPNGVTCAANCALDGADYTSTYGIKTSGNALSLQFKTGSNVGSRVYLMDDQDKNYQMFNLKNQEFTFDVDVSQLECECANFPKYCDIYLL